MEKGSLIQGKYEVLELLGYGGMSNVYLVLDLKLEKSGQRKKFSDRRMKGKSTFTYKVQ